MKNLVNTSLDTELNAERTGVRELRVRMSKKARGGRAHAGKETGEFDPMERRAGREVHMKAKSTEPSLRF